MPQSPRGPPRRLQARMLVNLDRPSLLGQGDIMDIMSAMQRIRWTLALAALAAALPLHAADLKADPSCAEVSAWVEAHRHELPRTFEELARFPAAYRTVIFDALTPEEKSAVRRAGLAAGLATAELEPRQREVIARAIDAAAPELYRGDPARRAIAEEIDRAARESFDPATARRVFGLAPEAEPAQTHMPNCNCNVDDWIQCDIDNLECIYAACKTRETGCGTLLNRPCDGMCAIR